MPATRVHFNGSVNLADTKTVMREIGSRVPAGVSRIPDGETGERAEWVAFQRKKLLKLPGITVSQSTFPSGITAPRFHLSGDVSVAELDWPDPAYADVYSASYQDFARLRADGTIPADVRFQVQFPTPLAMVLPFAPDDRMDELVVRSEQALFADLRTLLDRVPHADLAVQWDVAREFSVLARAHTDLVSLYDKDQIARMVSRCLDQVPADVPAGLHLCYGDLGHKHAVEPESLELQVALVNGVVATARRRLSWVAFTVPQDRADLEFFAPLRSLRAGTAECYFGIVPYHPAVQAPGTTERQAKLIETNLPSEASAEWGISTECGMGRVERAEIPAMLDQHRELLNQLGRTPRVG